MKIMVEMADKTEVGHFSVEYPQLSQMEPEEEYDEDEQLYKAVNTDALKRKYEERQIGIFRLKSGVFAIAVPRLANTIAETAVAAQVARFAPSARWIVLAPLQMNNGTTVALMLTPAELPNWEVFPKLAPPHFVTGPAAAVISQLRGQSVSALVLNAEGHPGLEKVDGDAVMDAAHVTQLLFGADYVSRLSRAVRAANSRVTSGMYL